MKKYDMYAREYIGASDVASLILVGNVKDKGVHTEVLPMGSDGDYRAYIVDGDAEIGKHYSKVATFNNWLKIYDDEGLTFTLKGEEINVYRGGESGCILQAIN